MKVLFSHSCPFFLSHGGSQTLTDELMLGMRNLGIEAEPERWWDEKQTGDVLHYIGRPNKLNVLLAKKKGFKVTMTDLLDVVAARPRSKLFLQRAMIRTVQTIAPGMTDRLGWDVYREADAMIFALGHESEVAQYLFDAPPDRCHVIPWGMRAEAMAELAKPAPEGDYLVSLATIIARKNNIELARAAKAAEVPVVFVGKPINEADEYFQEFKRLVDDKFVRYAGFVSEHEKYRLLRGARGFALLSSAESGCVAVYEAAAAGLPLFLTDSPWARNGYPGAERIVFADPMQDTETARDLKSFYASARRLARPTFPLITWDEVAEKYIAIYRQLLAASQK